MASVFAQHRLGSIARSVLFFTMAGLVASTPLLAQEKKEAEKAGSVFDDEKKTDGTEKKADATKTAAVSDRDTIGFSQQNAAAQMNELEERMFRLSEALRGLEPENASRLRLALKFSREEQILEQMRETHKLSKDAQLSKAETEVERADRQAGAPPQPACWPKTSTSSSSWRGSARCARRSASSTGSSRKSGASWAGRASPWSNASASSGSLPAGPTWRRSSATSRP